MTAQIPDTVTSSQATVEVTLPSSVGDITASAYSTVQGLPDETGPEVALPAPPEAAWAAPDWLIYAGVGVLGLGLLLGLLMLVPAKPHAAERGGADHRLQHDRGGAHDHPGQGRRGRAGPAREAAAGLLERNRGLDARITHRLEGAGSDLKSSEWLLLHAAVFIGSGRARPR